MKLSAEQKRMADETLTRLDKVAEAIEIHHQDWGLPFDTAKYIVNHIDKQADRIEETVYGKTSLKRRQVEVLKNARVFQHDSDEPYMASFDTGQVYQQDGDEPYMAAYADDDGSNVGSGSDGRGRRLVPTY